MSTSHQPPPTETEIAARASELWRIAGNPAGRDLEFWLAAESELKRDRDVTARTADDHPVPEYSGTKTRGSPRRKT
jgi:hypothetical protein